MTAMQQGHQGDPQRCLAHFDVDCFYAQVEEVRSDNPALVRTKPLGVTQKHIIVPQKEVGDLVNLEADVLGKYIERSMSTLLERVETLEAKLAALSSQ